MKKTLITGSDGFIGSHLVEELVTRGEQVRAFVYYNAHNSYGCLENLSPEMRNSIEIVSGDIRDPHAIKAAMNGCDKVYHLAALVAIPYSYFSPGSYIDTNITGTLNILQAAKELGVRVVHTSTSEVYGTAQFVPITEEHPLQGQSPYSASKIGADQIAHSFYCSFNLPVSIIRPFNTYGPRQSARAIIPTIITQLLSGYKEITLGSLTPTRDFNYVKDIVDGFITIMSRDESIGKTINVGSGFEVSIGELANVLIELIGSDAVIKEDSSRMRPKKSEVERLLACNSKAKAIGWSPKYSGIEGLKKGLSETINWFGHGTNINRYKPDIYNI